MGLFTDNSKYSTPGGKGKDKKKKRKLRKSKKSEDQKEKDKKTKRKRKLRKSKKSEDQEEKDNDLFDAISSYDYDEVENALNNGANVNARNKDDDTPLIRAIKLEDIDMVYLLLEDPGIDIKLDFGTNEELRLAEELTPEDEEQNGIPYAIEEYIRTKNREAKEAKEALFGVANRLGRENSNTIAARVLGQTVKVTDEDGKELDIHPFAREINEYVGGKRKTRKKNSRGRKTRRK